MMQRRDARSAAWRLPTWRLAAFAAIVAIALIALVARIVQIQIVDGATYRARALANRIRLIPVAAPRGIIADRYGRVLARSRPSFVVAADSIRGGGRRKRADVAGPNRPFE